MNYDFIPDRPIAFNRDFVDLGIGITGALLLSQAIYWSKRTKDTQGWFYKTADEWQEETGMTRNEQETARKKLRELGILEEKRAGLPAKLYYRINAYKLGELLTSRLAKSDNQDSHNVPNITIQRLHSEITTETNTRDNNKKINKKEILLEEYKNKYPEANERVISILEDFISYRKQIGKPIKTLHGLIGYGKKLRELAEDGKDIYEAIKKMKDNEWQTVY